VPVARTTRLGLMPSLRIRGWWRLRLYATERRGRMHRAGSQPACSQTPRARTTRRRSTGTTHDGLTRTNGPSIDRLARNRRLSPLLGWHPWPWRRRSPGGRSFGLLQSSQHRWIRGHYRPRRGLPCQTRTHLSSQGNVGRRAGRTWTGRNRMRWGRRAGRRWSDRGAWHRGGRPGRSRGSDPSRGRARHSGWLCTDRSRNR
jgi:hypothetical protein